jgi:hypothetical protein
MGEENENNPNSEISNVPLFPNITLIFGKLLGFLDAKGFASQLEKKVKGRGNVGFVDSAFEAMMKSVGWQSSQAWCAFYVKLVLMQLFSFDKEWLSKNIGGSALQNLINVQNLNKKGDKKYLAFTKGKLQVGDIFCAKRTKGGHTGIIVQILDEKTNYCETIEGNTDSTQTGEGDKVKKLKRYLTVGKASGSMTIVGFYRRNFTEEELKNIKYDENKQTYVFDIKN